MDFYLKRNDTLPIIEYTCLNEAGNPENVSDSTIKFCMGWKFYLPAPISTVTTTSFVWLEYAPYLLIGDVLAVNQERMLIEDINRITNTVTVIRGVDLTEAAVHPANAIVQLLRVESAGAVRNDGTDGVVKYEWSAVQNDTKMSGRFDAEFEINFLSSGKRQTYPTASQNKIKVIIKDDINVR